MGLASQTPVQAREQLGQGHIKLTARGKHTPSVSQVRGASEAFIKGPMSRKRPRVESVRELPGPRLMVGAWLAGVLFISAESGNLEGCQELITTGVRSPQLQGSREA